MASKRPSVQKREREQKKRERQLRKAAKAAEKRTAPPAGDVPSPADGVMPQKDDQSC